MGVGRAFAEKAERLCLNIWCQTWSTSPLAPLLLAAEMADHGLAGGDHQNVITLYYTAPAAAGAAEVLRPVNKMPSAQTRWQAP